MYINYIAEI